MHKQSGVVVPSEPDPVVSSPPSVGLGQHRQVVCQGEEDDLMDNVCLGL